MVMAEQSKAVARIVEALGLKNVRSLTISASVGSAVAIVTEQYAEKTSLERFAGELETREFVLVAKEDYENLAEWKKAFKEWKAQFTKTPALTDDEREAIQTAIDDDEVMHHHARAATFRKLLERLK